MRKPLFLIAALAVAGLAQADYTLTVLHTNDLHAHIEPSKVGSTMLGGYAKQATLVKKFRAEDPNTILLNGGDTFQGTLYFNQYTGFADLAIMNVIGYDGMAVGNHEFDLGPGPLADFAKYATFPVLSANLDVSEEEGLATTVKPHAVKVVGGQKIGMIGATTPELPSISSPGPNVKLIDLYNSINKSIAALRSEGVNKIVLLSHLGYDLEKDVAKRCTGLDVIVGGHSHSYLGQATEIAGFAKPSGPYPTVIDNTESKVLLVSSWEWGKVFGRIKVNFDDDGKVKDWSDAAPVLVDDKIPDDPTVAAMVAALSKPIDSLKKTVVATTPYALNRDNARLGNSNLGNLIADGMLAAGEKAGAKIAFMNNGGIRANIDQGAITFNEVIETSPFGNTLVIMDVTGEELLAALELGAARWGEDGRGIGIHVSKWTKIKYDVSKPVGQRVVSATINGEPVEKGKTYRIVTNSFMAGGGDGFESFKNAKGYRVDTGTLDRDALVDYLKAFKGEDLTGSPRIEVAGG
jgi:5'-nucleotidase/UDP-sugar diphosphatase